MCLFSSTNNIINIWVHISLQSFVFVDKKMWDFYLKGMFILLYVYWKQIALRKYWYNVWSHQWPLGKLCHSGLFFSASLRRLLPSSLYLSSLTMSSLMVPLYTSFSLPLFGLFSSLLFFCLFLDICIPPGSAPVYFSSHTKCSVLLLGKLKVSTTISSYSQPTNEVAQRSLHLS